MKRRTVLQLAGLTSAWPAWVLGQTPKQYRLGWLYTTSEATTKPLLEKFLGRMRQLGYVVGRNLVNDMRWAEGDASRYPALADELIALKPDVLLGIQEAAMVMAARTKTIPIVLISSSDPVEAGLVKSFARPGTNVTGMAGLYGPLMAKQIELLAEVVPKIARVALLNDSSSASRERNERIVRTAAKIKGLTLIVVAARDQEGIRQAFAEFRKQRADAVIVAPSGPMTYFRDVVASEALRLRLPSICGLSQYADSGGLINYSPNILDNFVNEIPTIVDQILRGAKPADLPVQQSTKYELVINLKTARAIGLTIPLPILQRADRVIEWT